MRKSPILSVIVATKNEEANIGRCLSSLVKQKLPKNQLEIIVVDNNSPDQTKKIALRFIKQVFNYPLLSNQAKIKNFRGAQLNFGVKMSKGEIIFFPDADMTFSSGLLSQIIKKMEAFNGLYIPEIVKGQSLFGQIRNFERGFYNQTCIDALRVVKKKTYLKVGGFDEKNIKFGPDDWDFTKMIKKEGGNLGITKLPVYHHEKSLSLFGYLNKKGKYTPTFKGYLQKWGAQDPDLQKQFGITYRYFKVFLEKGKWKKIIKHPLLTLGTFTLKVFAGAIYLKERALRK